MLEFLYCAIGIFLIVLSICFVISLKHQIRKSKQQHDDYLGRSMDMAVLRDKADNIEKLVITLVDIHNKAVINKTNSR